MKRRIESQNSSSSTEFGKTSKDTIQVIIDNNKNENKFDKIQEYRNQIAQIKKLISKPGKSKVSAFNTETTK